MIINNMNLSSRTTKLAALVAGIAIAIVGLAIRVAFFSRNPAGPVSWRFPHGYRGWVVLKFGDSSCAPLAREGIYLIVPIAPSGKGCTSTPVLEGWRYTLYEYVDASGGLTKLSTKRGGEDVIVLPVAISREKNEE